MFLFDVGPPAGVIGGLFAVAFFFIVVASGVFAFIMLRKTIKMAIRLVVVAAILLIAVFGSIALWLFLQPAPRPNRPLPNRPPASQTR